MVYYFCEACSIECHSNRHFNTHINTKKHLANIDIKSTTTIPTTISTTNTCIYCKATYTYKSGLSSHMKKCETYNTVINFGKIIGLQKKDMIKFFANINDNKQLVKDIIAKPISTEQHVINNSTTNNTNTTNNNTNTNTNNTNTTHNNSHNTTNTTNNTNSNNTTNNNIVMIMPFGQEDLSMITDEMRKNIITRGHCAYEHLLNEIYKHPQNHNVFYGNKRNKMVKYLDTDHKLRVKKEKEIIEDIVSTNVDRLDSFVDDHIESLDTKQKKYAGILKDIHSDKVVRRKKKDDYAVQTQCKLDEITPECRTTVKGQASIKNG